MLGSEVWWRTELGRARLEYEIRALELAGIAVQRDEQSFAQGVARLVIHPLVGGERQEMRVTFPDAYPYFRFAIDAPGLALAHHQHAFGKTLCLLGRASDQWKLSDTVAGLLESQLGSLIRAGRSENRPDVAHLEEQQGEPFSDYYSYAPSLFQIDGQWVLSPGQRSGFIELAVLAIDADTAEEPPRLFARVLRVLSEDGLELVRLDPALLRPTGNPAIFRGRWVRTEQPIAINDPSEFFAAARELDPHDHRLAPSATLDWRALEVRFSVRAVIFPEERSTHEIGDGWVFSVRAETRAKGQPARKSKYPMRARRQSVRPRWNSTEYLARAGRVGREDLIERMPELRSAQTKCVAVFGAGCVGAPLIVELARAGIGKLRLLDDDVVDAATVRRWPIGIRVAGRHKVAALLREITEQYPYTEVEAFAYRLGSVRSDGTSEVSILRDMLDGADLVIDSTADEAVQRYLSEVARARELPYIAVSGTDGGWGGLLVRVRPGKTEGCWLCARLSVNVPSPTAKAAEGIQPAGCANPTFTAAGFDMTSISLHATRLAVSTLCEGVLGGYPPADWDILVQSHRTIDGAALTPSVTLHQLHRHPECPLCRERDAA